MKGFSGSNGENLIAINSSFIKKLVIIFIVIAALYYAKDFLMPLSIGAVIATLFLPFCNWMEMKKLYRGFAAFICVFLLILAMVAVGLLIGWQISELTNDIDIIKQKISNSIIKIQQYIFDRFEITLEKQSQIIKTNQPSVKGIIPVMAVSFATIFTDIILTAVYIFGLLYYRDHIKLFLLKLYPNSERGNMEKVVYNVTKVSQQYLIGLSKMILCLWLMYGIGFSIIGVKNALFFAILCGMLEIVPFIGNITGTSITVLVTAAQGGSPTMLIGIICTYGFIQFIQGWILEPIILGPQVKINPLFTIIALVIGELVWGIPGIFLGIPLIAMFKIVCDNIESLKPYGFLIGEVDNGKKRSGAIKKIKGWFKM